MTDYTSVKVPKPEKDEIIITKTIDGNSSKEYN